MCCHLVGKIPGPSRASQPASWSGERGETRAPKAPSLQAAKQPRVPSRVCCAARRRGACPPARPTPTCAIACAVAWVAAWVAAWAVGRCMGMHYPLLIGLLRTGTRFELMHRRNCELRQPGGKRAGGGSESEVEGEKESGSEGESESEKRREITQRVFRVSAGKPNVREPSTYS